MKTIDVIVSPDGASRVETSGYTGETCRQASEFLEQALGVKASETLKAEYFQAEVRDQQQARQQS